MIRCVMHFLILMPLLVACTHNYHGYQVANFPQRAEIALLGQDDIDKIYEGLRSKKKSTTSELGMLINKRRNFNFDDSVLYAAYQYMDLSDARSKDSFEKIIYIIRRDHLPPYIARNIGQHIMQPELRIQAIRLLVYLKDPVVSEWIVKMTEHFMSYDLARLYASSQDIFLAELGRHWLKKRDYPALKNPLRMVVRELSDSDIETFSKTIIGEKQAGRSPTIAPHELDHFIYNAAICVTDSICWKHRNGRMIFDALKALDNQVVIDAMSRQIYYYRCRVGILALSKQLEIPGAEERFVSILQDFGDMGMANDFLNSGSKILSKAARDWAAKNGYSIQYRPVHF